MKKSNTLIISSVEHFMPKSQLIGYDVDVMIAPAGTLRNSEGNIIATENDEFILAMKKDQMLQLRDVLNKALAEVTDDQIKFGNFTVKRSIEKRSGYVLEHKYIDQDFALTGKEYKVLMILARNLGSFVPNKDMLTEAWDEDSYFNERSMNVYIVRLKQKLSIDKEVAIHNARGQGYKLMVNNK